MAQGGDTKSSDIVELHLLCSTEAGSDLCNAPHQAGGLEQLQVLTGATPADLGCPHGQKLFQDTHSQPHTLPARSG